MGGPSGRFRVAAQVGVELPWHERVMAIPETHRAACLGCWLAANCYSRWRELDGFCPRTALVGYATEEVVSWLVAVGLFSAEEHNGVHGFRVLRYEDWNETKDEINKRLKRVQQNTKRVTDWRTQRKRNALHNDKQANNVRVSGSVTLGIGEGEGIGSLSLERETGSAGGPESPPAERAIQVGDTIPPEQREAARLLEVQDIDLVWVKFVGHYAGQVVHVAGRWSKWCADELPKQRRDRERARSYRPQTDPTEEARAEESRKRQHRELVERQKRDERDALPPEANAESAAKLLAALDKKGQAQ